MLKAVRSVWMDLRCEDRVVSEGSSLMAPKDHWHKGDFKKTNEPSSREERTRGTLYVIQKHAATRLHYDLRLEMDGVLRSWAIPKTPPTASGIRRLAIQVEDHPLKYADFDGTIPEGQYGAGTVEIWDRGEYTLMNKKESELIFQIKGCRLEGVYCLIRFKGKNNWLFFRKKED